MGSLRGKVGDEYNEYVKYCERRGITPKLFTDGFYDHWEEIKSNKHKDRH